MNLKLRRYVQKSTLKRTYMTVHMGDYVFDEFVRGLNKGLLFKDSNIYTQFSAKNRLVNEFYERYFTKECLDLPGDLRQLFNGFVKHVSHPQLMMCTLKNIARDYPSLRGETNMEGFVGIAELQQLWDMTNSYFSEQVFSARYLCYKYMWQLLSLYLQPSSQGPLNHVLLLKIVGKMPIEFFSGSQTIYRDMEGLGHSKQFIERLGPETVDAIVKGVAQDLFQVKALVHQSMPKYGKEVDLAVEGLAKVILIMSVGKGPTYIKEVMSESWS
jgi:hypothetical protein